MNNIILLLGLYFAAFATGYCLAKLETKSKRGATRIKCAKPKEKEWHFYQ